MKIFNWEPRFIIHPKTVSRYKLYTSQVMHSVLPVTTSISQSRQHSDNGPEIYKKGNQPVQGYNNCNMEKLHATIGKFPNSEV